MSNVLVLYVNSICNLDLEKNYVEFVHKYTHPVTQKPFIAIVRGYYPNIQTLIKQEWVVNSLTKMNNKSFDMFEIKYVLREKGLLDDGCYNVDLVDIKPVC